MSGVVLSMVRQAALNFPKDVAAMYNQGGEYVDLTFLYCSA
jgi:hypothetical protein